MKEVYLLDLISGISKALDHISPTVTGHHRRVGIASSIMAHQLGMSSKDATDLLLAGLMHDIGAFSLDLQLDGLEFDADLTEHSEMGYRLLRGHPLLHRPAMLIKDHHTPWQMMTERENDDTQNIFLHANILNLMDRVDVLNKVGVAVFGRDRIRKVVSSYTESVYAQEGVAAFSEVSACPTFWERMEDRESPLRDLLCCEFNDVTIPEAQLLDFSRFFSHIIDFRSRHTATHSMGVAETAVELARLAGMDEVDRRRIRLAGHLHDIGKLAVPVHLLDKPASLDNEEYTQVQDHANVCENVLRSIPGLEDIADWACQHHERLNGKGYPHGLRGEQLSLGSRIVAVADVCTAISEDRPYRQGMPVSKAQSVLASMAQKGFLDHDLVQLTIDNYDSINAVRRIAQTQALMEFRQFRIS